MTENQRGRILMRPLASLRVKSLAVGAEKLSFSTSPHKSLTSNLERLEILCWLRPYLRRHFSVS